MAEACTNCGTDLPDGAAFCAECGAAASASVGPAPSAQPWPSAPPPHPPTPFTAPPTEAPYRPPAPASPPADGSSVRNTAAGLIGFVGALVLGVASFLAWAEVSLGFLGRTQRVNGWDWFNHGVASGPLLAGLALVAAGLAGLMFAQVAPPVVRVLAVALGAISLGVVAFAFFDILDRRSDLVTVGQAEITLQAGIVLGAAGALAILVSGLLAKAASTPSAG